MEYCALTKPVKIGDFNNINDIRSLDNPTQCLTFGRISQLGSNSDGGLSFFDNDSIKGVDTSNSSSIILATHQNLPLLEPLFPNSSIIPLSDPRSLFIDIIENLISKNMLSLSSAIPSNPCVSDNIKLGNKVILEDGIQIDDNVIIGSGSVIKRGTWLQQGVVIGENVVVGNEGINLHKGYDNKRRRFPHIAGVIIKANASIGASTVITRGTLTNTIIGEDSIIGNLCNIGHSSTIANKVWISTGAILGGYTKVGAHTNIAMGCTIKNGLSIGDYSNIGMGSVVVKSVPPKGSVFGNPAKPLREINAGPA